MAADPNVVAALSKTDLFSSLSKRALERVASQATVVHHEAGKEITEEGGGGVGFHLITDGSASVTVHGAQKGSLGPGQYFGEISLIDGKPRSATVKAETPLTTVSLVTWVFTPILDEVPEVSKALLKVMCARLRAAETG
jgi:CRP-like cAMP-binding protein